MSLSFDLLTVYDSRFHEGLKDQLLSFPLLEREARNRFNGDVSLLTTSNHMTTRSLASLVCIRYFGVKDADYGSAGDVFALVTHLDEENRAALLRLLQRS